MGRKSNLVSWYLHTCIQLGTYQVRNKYQVYTQYVLILTLMVETGMNDQASQACTSAHHQNISYTSWSRKSG